MNASYRLVLLIICLLLVVPTLNAQDEVTDLLTRINTLRASLGLHPYTLNGALSVAAQQQAQWMVDTGEVTHVRPDGSSPRSRAMAAGYGSVDVSENIYMGGMANVDYAWNFWINSPIHYSGLTHTRYFEIGIGAAHGVQGAGYALVFGNPGVLPPAPPQANVNSAGSAPAVPPQQPSYVLGLDERGNIMHEVQQGDTIGDILLIYGYTWDELPYLLELNGLADGRALQPGTVFLVPPHAGTYTPTPGGPPETAATATLAPSTTPSFLPTPGDAPQLVAQLPSSMPYSVQPSATPEPAGTNVAMLPQGSGELAPATSVTLSQEGTSPWLLVAVGVQVGVLAAAAFELVRRARRR